MWLPRWSLGSALFLASWAAMMGPVTYGKHLLSTPRLPFTAAYFGSIILTLYFSLGVSPAITSSQESLTKRQLGSTILTLFSALIQLACLIWYLVSYFPMGSAGLRMASTFGAQRAAAWMTGWPAHITYCVTNTIFMLSTWSPVHIVHVTRCDFDVWQQHEKLLTRLISISTRVAWDTTSRSAVDCRHSHSIVTWILLGTWMCTWAQDTRRWISHIGNESTVVARRSFLRLLIQTWTPCKNEVSKGVVSASDSQKCIWKVARSNL